MKKLLIIFSLLYISCKQKTKDTNHSTTTIENIEQSIPASGSSMAKFILTDPAQKITVSSDKINTVTGKKGLKIKVDPAALETEDGTPLGSQIEISLKELTNQEDLFRNDAPTVSDGSLLVSAGAYHIAMTSNGKNLRVKSNKTLSIQVPARSESSMELFYGHRDSLGNLNWKVTGEKMIVKKVAVPTDTSRVAIRLNNPIAPMNKKPVQKFDTSDFEKMLNYATKKNNKLSMKEFDSLNSFSRDATQNDATFDYIPGNANGVNFKQKETIVIDKKTGDSTTIIETTTYYPAEIRRLGWVNIDRFYKTHDKTLIECEFDSSVHVTEAILYVIYKNVNSLQREHIIVQNRGSSIKTTEQYPVGEKVKVIAIANVNGKLYSSRQNVVFRMNEKLKLKFLPASGIDEIKRNYRL